MFSGSLPGQMDASCNTSSIADNLGVCLYNLKAWIKQSALKACKRRPSAQNESGQAALGREKPKSALSCYIILAHV